MVQQVAEEQRLPLLREADHGVQVRARLRRHQRLQELHVPGGHVHVDHEVGPREGEEDGEALRVEQHRVELEPALRVVEHGDRKRRLGVAVHDLPDHVGGLVAVEGRAEHLHLVVRLAGRPLAAEVLEQRLPDEADVPLEVGEGPAPAEVGEDLEQGLRGGPTSAG